MRAALRAACINAGLAAAKIAAGIAGHSYALVADGVESTMDVFSSLIVWGSLRYSARPPDARHPYGHGKAESIAAILISTGLLLTALLIAVQSVQEILRPHRAPAPFTLGVLVCVVAIKELLFRRMAAVGEDIQSRAVTADAWHHRSDAITSVAAFIGISVALVGGPGFEPADDWAALVACLVIAYNGVCLLRPALDDIMDAHASEELDAEVRTIAESVEGVTYTEKCRIRRSGMRLLMDLHISVDGDLTVHKGHRIAHDVHDRLCGSHLPIADVVVHVEPDDWDEKEEGA